jgi:site-specific DNA-methyltransferase (adenine-specific)
MPKVNKALRNKTIDREITANDIYLARCKSAEDLKTMRSPRDITVHGDTEKILPLLPEGYFDLIIVDPPYNLYKNFHGESFSKMRDGDYLEYTRTWLSALHPLLREGGTIYVCCDWRSSVLIGQVLPEFFTVQNRITWEREKGRGAERNFKNSHEDIWFATKGDGYKFNLEKLKVRRKVLATYRENGAAKDWELTENGAFRDTCPSNFWDDITVPFWSMEENTAHPTQKPEKLIAKLILASTDEGDMILDPFLGSGTTSVVAKKLGRGYVGIEKNATYCSWAEERLERAEADKRIQGFDGERFYERHFPFTKKKNK